MKKYIITEENIKALINYLASRPFAEVHQGIQMLSSLPVIEEPKEEENKES